MEFFFQEAIGFDGVKSRVPEESIRRKLRVEESPMDLSSSGESDFFSTGISGCAALKVLSRKAI